MTTATKVVTLTTARKEDGWKQTNYHRLMKFLTQDEWMCWDNKTCIETEFGLASQDYPLVWVGERRVRCCRLSLSYKLKRKLVEGEVVRHICNNPKCINPQHLIVGTQADNVTDMVLASRQARGTVSGGSKLSENQYFRVFELRAGGMKQQAIADELGIGNPQVSRILGGKKWKHLYSQAVNLYPNSLSSVNKQQLLIVDRQTNDSRCYLTQQIG